MDRRGLCVARSTTMGNAKASERGTSNGYRLTSFLYMPIEYKRKQLTE